ncbi:MAG: M24 family metallopeptidase [Alphaproteobacteria bacterium]|nr:M24 family metallopeptidase [Alphaproteobacteria bacterium]
MAIGTSSYEGDEALARHLKAMGATLGIDAVRSLVAGVAGAPEGSQPDAWIDLVVPDAPAPLRDQLLALKISVEEDSAEGTPSADRLSALRRELDRRGLAGFVVPRTDEHQGEYVPPCADRLRWLTGFSGSAGMAIVLKDRAAIFVDGRYTLQVRTQVDTGSFDPKHLIETPPAQWIADNLSSGGKLGYDPWLHAENAVTTLRKAAEKVGGALVPQPDNPIDAIWEGQPAAPISPIVPHALEYAGKPAAEKRAEIGVGLEKDGCDAAVLTAPDSIAWLLNVRGGDVPRAPMPLSFAIVHKTGAVDWFVDTRKLSPGLGEHLGNGVSVESVHAFPEALEALADRTVRADPSSAAALVFDRLKAGGANIAPGEDPCALPKACKNEVEISGAQSAHKRDGVAVSRFLAWLEETAPSGAVTEIEAADKLAAFRNEGELIRDLSFDTISGSGSNGAIVHYKVSEDTDRRMEPGELYLVDSGAQYLDGTTDVTRTIAIGTPTAEMRDRFTRVLKGHIAIATARFPEGTSGAQLDILARHALWDAGLDFDHGTGHGVGSYLSVHEGPHRISKAPSTVALREGMIVSNEPGYYKTDAYGIRIENLVTVVPCAALEGAERKMFAFETLTFAPIDRSLMDLSLLSGAEIDWIDVYHARVFSELSPRMNDEEKEWLEAATRVLQR